MNKHCMQNEIYRQHQKQLKKIKLASGPNQHTRPHHSTNMKNKKGNKQKQPLQQICRYNHKVLPTKCSCQTHQSQQIHLQKCQPQQNRNPKTSKLILLSADKGSSDQIASTGSSENEKGTVLHDLPPYLAKIRSNSLAPSHSLQKQKVRLKSWFCV